MAAVTPEPTILDYTPFVSKLPPIFFGSANPLVMTFPHRCHSIDFQAWYPVTGGVCVQRGGKKRTTLAVRLRSFSKRLTCQRSSSRHLMNSKHTRFLAMKFSCVTTQTMEVSPTSPPFRLSFRGSCDPVAVPAVRSNCRQQRGRPFLSAAFVH